MRKHNNYPLVSFFPLLIVSILLSACSVGKIPSSKKYQTQYLLPELNGLYLGMPLAEFQKFKKYPSDLTDTPSSHFGFRILWTEQVQEGDVESIIYYFDADGEKPLYEFIVNHKADIDVAKLAREKYGPPNHEGKEWSFKGEEGFNIRAWVYQQKIVIVGKMKGTEWEEE